MKRKELFTVDVDINKVALTDEKLFDYKNKIELVVDENKKVKLIIELEDYKNEFEIRWYNAYAFFSLCCDLLLGKFTEE